MKRLIIFAICDLFCVLFCYSQSNINGVYTDNGRGHIEICNDKFIYAERLWGPARWWSEEFASATYSWIDDKFIELHDTASKIVIDKFLEIKQFKDESLKKKIKISISIPDLTYGDPILNILYTSGSVLRTKEITYKCGDKYNYVILPHHPDTITIFIKPKFIFPIPPDTHTGFYDSYVYYKLPTIRIEQDINSIEIIIPMFNPGYFGKYSVNGEYAEIDGNKIVWRGRVFTKQT